MYPQAFTRWLYRGQRPHGLARLMNRTWATVSASGVVAKFGAVTLDVVGRTSGRTVSLPLVLVTVDGQRYLVSMLGDDVPNDELNVAWTRGLHFGFPFCHQGDVSDPEFGAQRACSTTEPPVLKLGAHVASLGFRFYTGNMFPASYRNAAIIAEHGSWNRSVPSGYRVMVARTNGRKVTSYETFLDGFMPKSNTTGGRAATRLATGRPVDVLRLPDGSILVSDDFGNRILRVTYQR